MARRVVAGLSIVVLMWGAVALAEDPPPDLLEKEQAAFDKVASELLKLSRTCTQSKAYAEARAILDLGLRVCPDSAALREAREKIEGKPDTPRDSFAGKYGKKRAEAFLRCAKALASTANQFDRKGHADRFRRLFDLVLRHFPSEKGCEAFQLEYYPPYRRWMREGEVKKLEKGWDLLDGKWLDPGAVKEANAAHADWSDPWVVTDEVYEVRTTISLRKAQEVLGFASSFRRFFLSQFEGEWDLRPPSGRLPIEVTATQADYKARVGLAGAGVRSVSANKLVGSAMYYWTSDPLNPVVMTYEPVFPTSRGGVIAVEVGDEELFSVLLHELTHQLGFEYSWHGYKPMRYTKHCYGVIEGLAQFFAGHRATSEGFRLTFKPVIPHGDRTQEAAFAWTKSRIGSLPTLREYFAKTDAGLRDPEDYCYLATAAYFFLQGAEGKYRKRFLDLLQITHQIKEDRDTFGRCLEGIPPKELQADWLKFVRAIPDRD